jgi:very-short-patch-repair endonuclease
LPIAFDAWGHIEVALSCAEARLAVELGGGQHFLDATACRRDRRKDALRRENGYFVSRFLAEDVGKRLYKVLDTIIRALELRGVNQQGHFRSTPEQQLVAIALTCSG